MSDDDFVCLVRRMRQAQKDYFRTRAPGDLDNAKRLERQVDAVCFLKSKPVDSNQLWLGLNLAPTMPD